jgi:RNA polymerase sigma-70 factor (ECF subfamily)
VIMLMIAAMDDDDDKTFMLNLYKDYYALVRKVVYSMISDNKDIEDLINDTFIKLIEKVSLIRTFDGCKTAAYVVYTARSVTINFIKHRDVQRKHTYYGGEADAVEEIISSDDSIEDSLIHRETLESLSDAVLKLPEKQKNLLYFKYILSMSDTEIAEDLGIGPNSVRQYLTRARRDAKKLMEKER